MRVIVEHNRILYELIGSGPGREESCRTCEIPGGGKYTECTRRKFCKESADIIWGYGHERAWRRICPREES